MAGSQPGGFDALGDCDFVDFSQYDSNSDLQFHVPSLSPSTSSSLSPLVPLKTESSDRPFPVPSNESFTGPSHQYDLYKQQTGFVPGALDIALSLNERQGYLQEFLNLQQQSNFDESSFDFNTDPAVMLDTSALDMSDLGDMGDMGDMGFPPTSPEDLYLNSTINPSIINGPETDTLPSPMPTPTPTTGNYARPWPGMHQQAALAKAQQQQQQQQRRERQRVSQQAQKARSPQTSDSIAHQSVQHIMNAIRSEPVKFTPVKTSPAVNFPKKHKSESEMDPDEKFLASEEAKKLDSRERRQLRNKVSARAFRGRRKEYISWLEGQLTDKGNEVGLLRAKNRALEEENARMNGLTRELLSAPQFRDYVSDLASNPDKLAQLATTSQPAHQQQQIHHQPQLMNPQQRAKHFQQQFQQYEACYAA